MIVEATDIAVASVGPPPAGPEGECPPLAPVTQIHGRFGRSEDKRASFEHPRQRIWIILRVRSYLGEGDVASCVDKVAELVIGYRSPVHPKTVHGDAVGGSFFRIMLVRAHPKRTAWYAHHVRMRRIFNRPF